MRVKTLPTSSFGVMGANLLACADGSESSGIQPTVPPSQDSPRRIAVAVVVTLALTALAVPVVAVLVSWAFPAPAHRYQARVLCGENGAPSRSCRLQDIPRAEFVDHYDAKRGYRRCVTRPNAAVYCDELQTAPRADPPIAAPPASAP